MLNHERVPSNFKDDLNALFDAMKSVIQLHCRLILPELHSSIKKTFVDVEFNLLSFVNAFEQNLSTIENVYLSYMESYYSLSINVSLVLFGHTIELLIATLIWQRHADAAAESSSTQQSQSSSPTRLFEWSITTLQTLPPSPQSAPRAGQIWTNTGGGDTLDDI